MPSDGLPWKIVNSQCFNFNKLELGKLSPKDENSFPLNPAKWQRKTLFPKGITLAVGADHILIVG
jgi:hypothetical protein